MFLFSERTPARTFKPGKVLTPRVTAALRNPAELRCLDRCRGVSIPRKVPRGRERACGNQVVGVPASESTVAVAVVSFGVALVLVWTLYRLRGDR
jgi:hypothetical protein